jgi:hypothetical protein
MASRPSRPPPVRARARAPFDSYRGAPLGSADLGDRCEASDFSADVGADPRQSSITSSIACSYSSCISIDPGSIRVPVVKRPSGPTGCLLAGHASPPSVVCVPKAGAAGHACAVRSVRAECSRGGRHRSLDATAFVPRSCPKRVRTGSRSDAASRSPASREPWLQAALRVDRRRTSPAPARPVTPEVAGSSPVAPATRRAQESGCGTAAKSSRRRDRRGSLVLCHFDGDAEMSRRTCRRLHE